MRFRWDADNLYVAATVYDDILERHAPANSAWNSDCIELFLSFDVASKAEAAKSKKLIL
jgi:cellulose/xylan binding protein with CBM9 domain